MRLCPICESKDSFLFDQQIVCCSECGLFYLRRLPSTVEYQRILEKETAVALKPLSKKIRSVHQQRLDFLARFVPKQAKILDLGCGRGTFLKLAQKAGYQVTGLDKSRKLTAFLQQQKLPVVKDLRQVRDSSLEAITLFDVLEHVARPRELLLQLKSKLKEGGVLLLTTPNRQGISGRIWKNRAWGIKPTGHLLAFNFKSIKLLLEKSGFQAVEQTTNQISWWYLGRGKFWERLINKGFYLLVSPFKRLLFSLSWGDNLQILARS